MLKRPFSQRMALRQNPSPFGRGVSSDTAGRSGAAWAGGAIWLVAALCAGYWVLQAGGQGPWVPLQGLAPSVPQADVASVSRALGALAQPVAASADAAPPPPARVRLVGLVAQGRMVGAALLAVDDQLPRPWRVGSEVADGLVLQSVSQRGVKLGESRSGPATLELEMPEPQVGSQPTVRSMVVTQPQPQPQPQSPPAGLLEQTLPAGVEQQLSPR